MKNDHTIESESTIQPIEVKQGINKSETLKTQVSYTLKKEEE